MKMVTSKENFSHFKDVSLVKYVNETIILQTVTRTYILRFVCRFVSILMKTMYTDVTLNCDNLSLYFSKSNFFLLYILSFFFSFKSHYNFQIQTESLAVIHTSYKRYSAKQ